MVPMTFSGSVVANTNLTCGGGSSTTFSSALKPCVRHHVRLVDDVDLVARHGRRVEGLVTQFAGVVDAAVAGGVDLDDVDAARTTAGKIDDSSGTRRRVLESGPFSQLRQRARIRADVVLPHPRGPENR